MPNVSVTVANVTTQKIVLKDLPDSTGRAEFFALLEKKVPGTDVSKYCIGTRSMGEFKEGMELRDFGSQKMIYLEKLG
ncbi:hypothetical protein IWQ57_001217 [Coemansia nantahalensis]|uniref:Uncharacterized protein n=2 Tax=Coemansia TaxID=4863 RepID=A0ACC1L1E4_9FUNG|nr:hypothetical protein IWQ57_001217 [Coemansia nantahalensis]KAJ2798923.1 hypothetical protein H4R21_003733 [Coemansia helicoidea]